MLLSLDFGNIFISILLDISDIKAKENSDIDESKNFNASIWIHLASKRKQKEFTVIEVNLNSGRNDGEKHLYNKDDFYLEPNNAGYNNIIQINYIYNYYILHLGFKTINNFFSRTIFKLIKKAYKEEETKHWIFIIKTTMYRIFISSSEYPPIYIKEKAILEGY